MFFSQLQNNPTKKIDGVPFIIHGKLVYFKQYLCSIHLVKDGEFFLSELKYDKTSINFSF